MGADTVIRRLLNWLLPEGPEPWTPACPEARIELRVARSITWDYDRFRYHLDRAEMLERAYLSQR